MAASQTGRNLDNKRACGSDAELRVGRAVLDAERLGGGARGGDDTLCCNNTKFGRPRMSERHAEGRRVGRQAVGDRQRMEDAAD